MIRAFWTIWCAVLVGGAIGAMLAEIYLAAVNH
jgi:hypothetical protein